MITITTGGIGQVDVSSGVRQKSKSKEEVASDAFSCLINMTAVQPQDAPDVSGRNSVTPESEAGNEVYAVSGTSVRSADEADNSADGKKNIEPYGDGQNDAVENLEDAAAIDDELLDNVSRILADIRELIMETLGITEDEFDSLLADMNLVLADLTDMSVLKSFILQSRNATEVDMLIDEGLANLIHGLVGAVEALAKQYNISDIAEIYEMMENVPDSAEDEKMDINSDDGNAADEAVISGDTKNIAAGKSENEDVQAAISKDNTITVVAESKQGDYNSGSSDKSYENIVANLNKAIDSITAEAVNQTAEFEGDIQQADIIRQIIDEVKIHIFKESTSIELQLNPEHLGKVQISVASKNGVMQAQILAETEAAKHAIENNIAALKDAFDNRELKVEAIEVMVAAYGFFEDGQDGTLDQDAGQQQSNGIKKLDVNDISEEDERTEEEKLEVEMMKAQGNSVSYAV